mmetsp:Transcript_29972/g.64184  ORF Transcript_29972/g.64184 Transcript_29972/m.64184 type:complete len:387 (-) Transcript_29972:292-1452(-)
MQNRSDRLIGSIGCPFQQFFALPTNPASRPPDKRLLLGCEQGIDLLGGVPQKARVVVSSRIRFQHGIVDGGIALADAFGNLVSRQLSQGRVLDRVLEGWNRWRVQRRVEFFHRAFGLVRSQAGKARHGHSVDLDSPEPIPRRHERSEPAQVQDVGRFSLDEDVDQGPLFLSHSFFQRGHHRSGHVSLPCHGHRLFQCHSVVEGFARRERGIHQNVARPVQRQCLPVFFGAVHVDRKAGRFLPAIHDAHDHGVREGRLGVSRYDVELLEHRGVDPERCLVGVGGFSEAIQDGNHQRVLVGFDQRIALAARSEFGHGLANGRRVEQQEAADIVELGQTGSQGKSFLVEIIHFVVRSFVVVVVRAACQVRDHLQDARLEGPRNPTHAQS